jgi:hypothetical protein
MCFCHTIMHKFCKSFFFMQSGFRTPDFPLDGSNGGQKSSFMTIRKWCRISGPCRHYYIAKSDIFIFIAFFDRKEPLSWRILGPKPSFFFHKRPTDLLKNENFVKKLKICQKVNYFSSQKWFFFNF